MTKLTEASLGGTSAPMAPGSATVRSSSGRMVSTLAIVAALGFAIGGCTILPSHGPASGSVAQGEANTSNSAQYAYIKLSPDVLTVLAEKGPPDFRGAFTDNRPSPTIQLGVGDVVNVTIFEAAPGGLFTPAQAAGARPGNFVELPAQAVDKSGNISVPYAGLIPAAGRTVPEVQFTIEQRLRNRAIEPQAVVAVREQRAAQVSVLGEVNTAGKFAVNQAGERILDVIARGGGPKFPAYETVVTLQRNNKKATVPMTRIVREPENNIFVRPGDTIYVSREQRAFVVLGASGQNGEFFFDNETVTLAQGVGKAGGLLDERADPGAVFLYRSEPRDLLASMGYDVSRFEGRYVPTVYALDLRDPSGFFLARQIALRDRDVLFVANAISVDVVKLLNFVRVGIATARESVSLGNSVRTYGTND
jgi:polysaccharide export outer membrane protein